MLPSDIGPQNRSIIFVVQNIVIAFWSLTLIRVFVTCVNLLPQSSLL